MYFLTGNHRKQLSLVNSFWAQGTVWVWVRQSGNAEFRPLCLLRFWYHERNGWAGFHVVLYTKHYSYGKNYHVSVEGTVIGVRTAGCFRGRDKQMNLWILSMTTSAKNNNIWVRIFQRTSIYFTSQMNCSPYSRFGMKKLVSILQLLRQSSITC